MRFGTHSSLSPEEAAFVVGTIALLGAVYYGGRWLLRQWRHRQWREVADDLDFDLDDGDFVLDGERCGVHVEVGLQRDLSSQDSDRVATEYVVAMGGQGVPPMRLRPEHKLLGIDLDSLLKSTEIEVGFDTLDDTFLINGPDKEAIREFFKRPGTGSALLRCHKNARGEVIYEKGRLKIEHGGIASEKRLRANIEAVARCAAAFGRAGGQMLAGAGAEEPSDQASPPAKFGRA